MGRILIVTGARNWSTTFDPELIPTWNNPKEASHDSLVDFCKLSEAYSAIFCIDPEYPRSERVDGIQYIKNYLDLEEIICFVEESDIMIIINYGCARVPSEITRSCYWWEASRNTNPIIIGKIPLDDILRELGPNLKPDFGAGEFVQHCISVSDFVAKITEVSHEFTAGELWESLVSAPRDRELWVAHLYNPGSDDDKRARMISVLLEIAQRGSHTQKSAGDNLARALEDCDDRAFLNNVTDRNIVKTMLGGAPFEKMSND